MKFIHAQEYNECWTHNCFRYYLATWIFALVSYCFVERTRSLSSPVSDWQCRNSSITFLPAIRTAKLRIMTIPLQSLLHHGLVVFWANQRLWWESSALAGYPVLVLAFAVDGKSQCELTECGLETMNKTPNSQGCRGSSDSIAHTPGMVICWGRKATHSSVFLMSFSQERGD